MTVSNQKHFPKGGAGRGLLLLAALLCLPLFLAAHKDDKNPKYLLGAVPEVNGIVTFQKDFSVTDKNEQQIYDIMLAYIKNTLIENAIQKQEPYYTRIISEEKENGIIVARIEEYMTFKRIPIISLDRTRFRYLLSASVKGQKVSLTITQISYYYNEDMDGKNGVHYKAEEWITDKEAVNKKGTKLYPRSGKFRRLTIDRVEDIFNGFMDTFSTKQGVVEG
jgi:colicin import membrane protein